MIIITPLVPRVPYIAVADPSFNTSIDSISSGATVLNEPGTPSTSISGCVDPINVDVPRNITEVLAVGSPVGNDICSPATFPCTS